jgi:hypothetical protein
MLRVVIKNVVSISCINRVFNADDIFRRSRYTKIFVAVTDHNYGWVVGTTTLLVEPKFLFGIGRVGHIEDVSVKVEHLSSAARQPNSHFC